MVGKVRRRKLKKVNRILFIVHIFVGLGAIGGGLMAILFPSGPAGMPTDALKNSPFSNYLIPGIILFSVIGMGNIVSALTMHFKSRYQGYISSIFSWALVIWIIVQCIMLRLVAILHVIYLMIGLVEAFLSIIILFRQQLFPTKIITNIINNLEKKYPGNLFIGVIGKFIRAISTTEGQSKVVTS